MSHGDRRADVAIPTDSNIRKKEQEKLRKYRRYKVELEKKVTLVPVVIGALGAVIPKLSGKLQQIPGTGTTSELSIQKSAKLGTAEISLKEI